MQQVSRLAPSFPVLCPSPGAALWPISAERARAEPQSLYRSTCPLRSVRRERLRGAFPVEVSCLAETRRTPATAPRGSRGAPCSTFAPLRHLFWARRWASSPAAVTVLVTRPPFAQTPRRWPSPQSSAAGPRGGGVGRGAIAGRAPPAATAIPEGHRHRLPPCASVQGAAPRAAAVCCGRRYYSSRAGQAAEGWTAAGSAASS